MRAALSLLAWGTVLVLTTVAWGDIPPPGKREPEVRTSVMVPVVIKHEALRGDDAVAKAKIVIPKGMLPTLVEEEKQGAVPRPIGGTVIAGIALSLAAVSVLWLRRGKSGNRPLLMVLVSGALVLGGLSALFADLAPPGRQGRVRPGPQRPMLLLEIVEEGDAVTLTLPPR
jgi:hypothetical protein